MKTLPTFERVGEAARRIRPYVHRAPVLTCSTLDHQVGAESYFKCENFQRAGTFKARGACNAVFSLSTDEAREMRLAEVVAETGATFVHPSRSWRCKPRGTPDTTEKGR